MEFNVKKLLNYFLYATEYPEHLKNIQSMVEEENYSSLRFFSTLFAVILALVSAVSFLIPTMMNSMPIYITGFILGTMLSLFSTRIVSKPQHKHLAGPCMYIILFMTLLFGIAIGATGQEPQPAVTFNVFMIIIPMIIYDAPYRINLSLLLCFIVYAVVAFMVKTPRIFALDIINGTCFFIIAVFINIYSQIRHVVEFSNRLLIKTQRDTDMLTGCLTKRAFELNVQRELRDSRLIGILMIIDVDNFKTINDTYGHTMGDYFIANTGSTLRACCRMNDMVGRFGGDEFMVFLPGLNTRELVDKKANEIMTKLHAFFEENMRYTHYSVSIGCTFFTGGVDTYEQLFNQVDKALYQAKKEGKDRFCIYRDSEQYEDGEISIEEFL